MLARLQQAWVFVLVSSALGGASWVLSAGGSTWAATIIALALLHVHAIVLAIEFVALSRIDPGPGVQKPGAAVLWRAWWGEVWTGFRVFCWRQPFRAKAVPDHIDADEAASRRAVLLVHGFVCNRGLWNPWLTRLRDAGVPFVAVNLEPVFGSIDRYVPIIDAAMRRLDEAGHVRPLIVAHSMGGLAVRAWLRAHDAEARVHSVVTIGTPHAGTVLARFGFSPNTRQMGRNSRWLRDLQATESQRRRMLFTCFYGHCDNIVVPACTARLEGADNRHVPGVAHVHLAFVPQILDEVLARTITIEAEPALTPPSGVADGT